MSDFVEAIVSLLPAEVGGRQVPVEPREGSYRPFACAGSDLLRIRMIEGPPRLVPGDEARVVLELETSPLDETLLAPGAELDLVEHGGRRVGIMSVMRLLRAAALFVVLLGCSSGGGVIHPTMEGGAGAPIEIQVSARMGSQPAFGDMGQMQPIVVVVEVSNNSDADVVVEQIAIVPSASGNGAYRLDPITRSYKELIEPGKEHDFELPTEGRQVRPLNPDESSTVAVRVAVQLQSGDQYVNDFEVRVPMVTR